MDACAVSFNDKTKRLQLKAEWKMNYQQRQDIHAIDQQWPC
jgi:hypothetical protein